MKSASPEGVRKQVGIWIRVSTEDQAQGDSPKHHELRARSYAEAKGWEVREVYDLAGVSGKSVREHPEARRMLDDVSSGRIQALVFSKLARLARNTRELLDFADYFRQYNADLVSLQESIDTSTPAGRLFYTMIAAMAHWEREEIASRVHASVAVRAKLGKPLSGKVPFGYRWEDQQVRVHPEEAPVRRLLYELFAEHRRKKTVARMLNERGFRARNGHFTDTTVERLIRDPSAKGEHRTNYTRNVGGSKGWALKPEHEWVVNRVEPIVPAELWQRCNDLLDARRTRRERPARRPVHPFAGFVACKCGTRMYVPSNTPKYVCAECRTKIPVEDLDAIFREELRGYLLSPDKVADYLGGARRAVQEKAALLESHRREGQRLAREVEQTFQLYYQGGLSADQFKARHQPLDSRRAQVEEELARAEAEIAFLRVNEASGAQIAADAESFHSRWPSMTPAEKRGVAELLLRSIVIAEGEVTINLCYFPSSEEMTERQRTIRGSSPRPA